uniref:PHD-type domain-containing protein n=1 Tax=Arundo donax TaxID=35708 RepID=A0A0A9ARF9_ARUDO
MEGLLKDKDTCSICHRRVGACFKCSTANCQITFHPSCARDAGLYMNTKRIGNVLQHKAYCGKHSIEQRKVRVALNWVRFFTLSADFIWFCMDLLI